MLQSAVFSTRKTEIKLDPKQEKVHLSFLLNDVDIGETYRLRIRILR